MSAITCSNPPVQQFHPVKAMLADTSTSTIHVDQFYCKPCCKHSFLWTPCFRENLSRSQVYSGTPGRLSTTPTARLSMLNPWSAKCNRRKAEDLQGPFFGCRQLPSSFFLYKHSGFDRQIRMLGHWRLSVNHRLWQIHRG